MHPILFDIPNHIQDAIIDIRINSSLTIKGSKSLVLKTLTLKYLREALGDGNTTTLSDLKKLRATVSDFLSLVFSLNRNSDKTDPLPVHAPRAVADKGVRQGQMAPRWQLLSARKNRRELYEVRRGVCRSRDAVQERERLNSATNKRSRRGMDRRR